MLRLRRNASSCSIFQSFRASLEKKSSKGSFNLGTFRSDYVLLDYPARRGSGLRSGLAVAAACQPQRLGPSDLHSDRAARENGARERAPCLHLDSGCHVPCTRVARSTSGIREGQAARLEKDQPTANARTDRWMAARGAGRLARLRVARRPCCSCRPGCRCPGTRSPEQRPPQLRTAHLAQTHGRFETGREGGRIRRGFALGRIQPDASSCRGGARIK
jgi:hypothetical protein